MTSLAEIFDLPQTDHPLRKSFLKWQCRVRQIAMRESDGQPDDALTPSVYMPGESQPVGDIITVLSKRPEYSKTPELQHIAKRTFDPAQRREKALQFLCEVYFQKADEFADTLTSTFSPQSQGAQAMAGAGRCRLKFTAYSQCFDLDCSVERLSQEHFLYQATWWHNLLFNPGLRPDSIVLAFKPDWESSFADPDSTQR